MRVDHSAAPFLFIAEGDWRSTSALIFTLTVIHIHAASISPDLNQLGKLASVAAPLCYSFLLG